MHVLTGIDLSCEAKVGRRLRIEHFGGIIVSGDAVIGDDVILRNGVTIGLKRTNERGAPVIGNRVDIGAGAKILGAIHIGDDAVIGANVVVVRDVPAGAGAVGIPARTLAMQKLHARRLRWRLEAEPVRRRRRYALAGPPACSNVCSLMQSPATFIQFDITLVEYNICLGQLQALCL